MPELPEIQALCERLHAALSGATLVGVSALQFSALKTVRPAPAEITGLRLDRVARRGKYLLFELSGPRLAVHLSQGGRVEVEDPPKVTKPRGAVMRLAFEDRPGVLVREYGTERKAGWWILSEGDDGPLAGLGPEPFSEEFASLVATGEDRRRLHTMLRDQRTVAGIGRGYSDDILHRARVSPFASLAALDASKRKTLLEAVHATLVAGLAAERRRSGGLPPKLGDHFTIHGCFGTPCPRCNADLRRVSYESHEVTYCPPCQTGGKVLADRRLSRLIR